MNKLVSIYEWISKNEWKFDITKPTSIKKAMRQISVCNNNHIDIKVSLTKIFIDKKISDNMFMYFSDNYVIESI